MTPQIRAVLSLRLAPAQTVLLLHLLTYPGEWCWPAIETLAHAAGLGVNAARRRLHEMAERGLLEIRERSWAPHCYRICWEHPLLAEALQNGTPDSDEDSQSGSPDLSTPPETVALEPSSTPETVALEPSAEDSRNGTQISPSTTIIKVEVTPTSLGVPRAKQGACQEAAPPSAVGEASAGGGGGWPPSSGESASEAAKLPVEEVFPKDYARALRRSKLTDLGSIARRSRSAIAARLGTWANRGRLDEIGAILDEHGLGYRPEGFLDPADRPGGGQVLRYPQRPAADETADPRPGLDAPEEVKEAWMRRNMPWLYDDNPEAEVNRG